MQAAGGVVELSCGSRSSSAASGSLLDIVCIFVGCITVVFCGVESAAEYIRLHFLVSWPSQHLSKQLAGALATASARSLGLLIDQAFCSGFITCKGMGC